MYQVEKAGTPFKFKVGSKSYSVPRLTDLPLKEFREMQKRVWGASEDMTEVTAVDAILDLFEKHAPGCTDELSYMQAVNLVKAYSTEDGETLGE